MLSGHSSSSFYAEGFYFYAEGFYFYAEGFYFYANECNCRGALLENVIVAGLSEECNCRGALLEGRRLICAHRFDSSAHTHFVSTCASSAHTDLTHARTQSIGETQVRTQALSRMFAHLKESSRWNVHFLL